jgi:hypothetical protein
MPNYLHPQLLSVHIGLPELQHAVQPLLPLQHPLEQPHVFDSSAKTSTFAKAMDDILLREFRFTFITTAPAIKNTAIPPNKYFFIFYNNKKNNK